MYIYLRADGTVLAVVLPNLTVIRLSFFSSVLPTTPHVLIKGGGHRVPPAGLPIEQVLGEYSLSFLRRDVALFVFTRARDSF